MDQEINDLKENIFRIEHSLNQKHKGLKVICISALVLSIISFVLMVLLVFTVFVKNSYDRAMSKPFRMPPVVSTPPTTTYSSSDSTERNLKEIQEASVIVYAKNVKKGKKIHCVLDEIWFKSKDADFTFKPGDKLPVIEHDVEPNTSYGEGKIVFFKGKSPSSYTASWSVHRNTVPTFKDLDLDLVKKMVKSIKDPIPAKE